MGGDVVVQRIGHQTFDLEVAYKTSGRALLRDNLGQVVHTLTPLTQSSLILCRVFKARKVAAGI